MSFIYYLDVQEELKYTGDCNKDLTKFLEWKSQKKINQISILDEYKMIDYHTIDKVEEEYICNNCKVSFEHTHCICGHCIKDVYKYEHIKSGDTFYIGNKCINRFRDKSKSLNMTDIEFNLKFKGKRICIICKGGKALPEKNKDPYHAKCFNKLSYYQKNDLVVSINEQDINDDSILKSGKYTGKTYKYIFDNLKGYVWWIMENKPDSVQMRLFRKYCETRE